MYNMNIRNSGIIMLAINKRLIGRVTSAAILAAAILGGSSAARGQADGGTDRPPDDKPPEKIDINDLRKSIGDLGLVRGTRDLTPPPPPGIWQQIVNRSYYPPPVKAQKLLFHGQYSQAEAAYNALLKTE